MPRPLPTLKTFYYLDHFREMVEFVESHYAGVLGEPHRDYIVRFRALSQEAQGLCVRIANRRGRIFKKSALRYAEIPDLESTARELGAGGFVRCVAQADFREALSTLTKPELLDLLRAEQPDLRGLSSLSKSQVAELAATHCPFQRFDAGSFVVQDRIDDLGYLLFLYFGELRDGLTAFALRDLGIVRTNTAQSTFEARFTDRPAAQSAYFYATLRARIKAADSAELPALATAVPSWPRRGDGAFDQAVARLGARLDKAGDPETALAVYAHSDSYPSTERRCRLRFARGERAAVEALLRGLIDDPSCDEELLFAEDFYARKFAQKRIGTLTALLRGAPVIRIDEAFNDSAEYAAVRHYRRQGISAHRAENHLWTTLFGTFFWPELRENAATPNAFENRPTQLLDGTFAARQAAAIEARLALLGTPDALRHTDHIFATRFGTPNGVFRWREQDAPLLREFLAAAPPAAVATTLRRMAANFAATSSGFPDLVLLGGGGVRFVEIKAEGDQIRRNQLVQIQALQAAGFEVEVVRVEWCVDPMQEYVVVDVETTGMRSEYHRVTEIGAVKVRAGAVVDRYQTLINPGRSIPPAITKLTGISDAMVADAPTFADVADAFRAFVGDAVFVAHNARFDYGFLRDEFARLGVSFRRPTLCTVVAMRRFYPGLASYRLGNLCADFGIRLDSHHRASCDAEATAGLLKLVNAKRLAPSGVEPAPCGVESPCDFVIV